MKRQDRQGVRTPADLERKYNLANITRNDESNSKMANQIHQLSQTLAQFMATTNAMLSATNTVLRDVQERLGDLEISTSTSGSIVTLSDLFPTKYTLKVKASNFNMLTSPYLMFANETTRASGGITYTDNGDGGIRLKGTATSSEAFTLANMDLGNSYIDASSGVESVTKNNYTISKFLIYDHTTKRVRVGVKSGVTVDEVIYPKVVVADISTAKVQRYGKNPFNIDKVVDEKQSGAYIEISGNDIIFTYGTMESNHFAFSCEVDVTPNTDYVLSVGKTTSVNAYYVYTDRLFGTSVKANVAINTGSFNSGNNNKLVIGFWSTYLHRVGTSEVISEIMLIRKDTQAISPEYEPYTEPTTYDINADGTVEGVELVYPTTMLIPDTEGIMLDVEYKENLKDYIDSKFIALAESGV